MNKQTKPRTRPREIPLNQRISFRLQRTGALLTAQAVQLLKQSEGLTLNQWRMLSFLSEREGGSAHELAKLGFIDKATMSRAAAELLKKGLIASNVSDEDRRSTILSLTSRGHDMVERVAPVMINRQSELMSSLTEAEHEALIAALDKLEAAVENSKLGDKG